MFCSYGSYKHAVGEVELSINRDVLFSDADLPYANVTRIDINGMLLANNQAEMDAKVRALVTAYKRTNQDFTVHLSNGQASYLQIKSRSCVGGLRVMRGPSFPSNRGAAYCTYLPYSISLEGEEPLTSVASGYRSFSETITRSGGGPRYGLLETLNTLPIPQQLKRATIFRATQSGTAVGLYALPNPPAAIWPAWLIGNPKIDTSSPKRRGSGSSLVYTDFAISWSYEYESVFPLIGRPTRWR